MTDHPSNPPSQEPSGEWMYRAALTVHIVGRCPDLRHGGLGLKACGPCYRVADALAAQEARHKAEMEKYREELVQISVWLPNHGGIGATVLTQVQTAVLEAESKLRQATEALGEVAIPTLRYCERKFGIDDQARLNCEAAIRSGQAQPPAEMVMGGSYEVALAAAFEAVKVLADYPPEQETPKPEPR